MAVHFPESPEAFSGFNGSGANCIRINLGTKRPAFDPLEAVRHCKGLRGLSIVGSFSSSWETLNEMEELENFAVDVAPPQGFSLCSPQLTDLGIKWWEGFKDSTVSRRLIDVEISGYPHRSLEALGELPCLDRLILGGRNLESLSGASELGSLRVLHVFDARSIKEIGVPPKSIEVLEVYGCSGELEICGVQSMPQVWFLRIEGKATIDSVDPILKLNELERLSLSGMTILDHLPSKLLEIKALRHVVFDPRRGYDMRAPEINNLLKERPQTESCTPAGFNARRGSGREVIF